MSSAGSKVQVLFFWGGGGVFFFGGGGLETCSTSQWLSSWGPSRWKGHTPGSVAGVYPVIRRLRNCHSLLWVYLVLFVVAAVVVTLISGLKLWLASGTRCPGFGRWSYVSKILPQHLNAFAFVHLVPSNDPTQRFRAPQPHEVFFSGFVWLCAYIEMYNVFLAIIFLHLCWTSSFVLCSPSEHYGFVAFVAWLLFWEKCDFFIASFFCCLRLLGFTGLLSFFRFFAFCDHSVCCVFCLFALFAVCNCWHFSGCSLRLLGSWGLLFFLHPSALCDCWHLWGCSLRLLGFSGMVSFGLFSLLANIRIVEFFLFFLPWSLFVIVGILGVVLCDCWGCSQPLWWGG